jgi:hypothetical protein
VNPPISLCHPGAVLTDTKSWSGSVRRVLDPWRNCNRIRIWPNKHKIDWSYWNLQWTMLCHQQQLSTNWILPTSNWHLTNKEMGNQETDGDSANKNGTVSQVSQQRGRMGTWPTQGHTPRADLRPRSWEKKTDLA